MTKSATATATVSPTTSAPADEAMDVLREANGLCEEVPPASEERPSLHLVTLPPPAVTEVEPEVAPDVAPLSHVCPECNARVADLPSVWSLKHGMCNRCAMPMLRKEEDAARKAAKTCACGNWKREDLPLCRDCHEKAQAETRKAAVTCPKCGGEKERHHRVCPSCYRASLPQRPAPAARTQQVRKGSNGRPVPEYKVDAAMQAKSAARAKLGQQLLVALRAGTLNENFPGAKATKDEADSAQVCLSYNGESYTLIDQDKVKAIAERKAEAAKAAQAAQAEAARKAAEARKAAAELAKANKSGEPKKGKKDKSGEKAGKGKQGGSPATKAERKAARGK